MTENMASLESNFDIFDRFLARKENNDEEEVVEEEESSSSYYEEEFIEQPLSRLSTVHEHDSGDSSNAEEDFSESEVFWEEVSESNNYESENAEEGDVTEELDSNSDMVERVRNMLRNGLGGDKNDSWQEAESSRYDSSVSEGSSSVPPMDFDLGSFEGDDPHSSDEEEEDQDPDYYEKACRVMIAAVHPNSDPDTLLHGCDVHSLYTNLKQQYRHSMRNSGISDALKSDSIRELLKRESKIVADDDADDFVGLSLKPESDMEIIPTDAKLCDANNISTDESTSTNVSLGPDSNNSDDEGDAATPTLKVEKWLERDADDPEDYEYACRLLCRSMYDANDQDYNVDTLLKRSTPVDLYRYLKHHFWYLVHTNQLDEMVLYRNVSNELREKDGEEKKLNGGDDKSMTIDTNMPMSNHATDEVLESTHIEGNHVEENAESLFSKTTGTKVLREIEPNAVDEKNDESTIIDENIASSNSATDQVSESINNKALSSNATVTKLLKEKEQDRDEVLREIEPNAVDEQNDESTIIDENIASPNSATDQVSESINNEALSSNATVTKLLKEKEQNRDENKIGEYTTMDTELPESNSSIFEVSEPINNEEIHGTKEDLESSCSNSISVQTSEESKRCSETNSETKNIDIHTKEPSIQCDVTEEFENNDGCIPSRVQECKIETENIQDENEHLLVKDPPTLAQDGSYYSNEYRDKFNIIDETLKKENIECNLNESTVSSGEERECQSSQTQNESDTKGPSTKDQDDELAKGDTRSSSSLEKSFGMVESTDESVQKESLEHDLNNTDSCHSEKESLAQLEREARELSVVDRNEEDDETASSKDFSTEASHNDDSKEEISPSMNRNLQLDEKGNESSKLSKSNSFNSNKEFESLSDDGGDDDSSLDSTIDRNGPSTSLKKLQNGTSESKTADGSSSSTTQNVNIKEGCSAFDTLNKKSNLITGMNESIPSGANVDVKESSEGCVESERTLDRGNCISIERNNSSLSLNHLQNIRSGKQVVHNERARPKHIVRDTKELEWRKKKIQEDLMSIIEETQEQELLQPLSFEIVAALHTGSLKTALTKKYYDPMRRDHIYFPSVAKAVQDFSLIEEAEKIYLEEFSFELSTALCSVATSRIKKIYDEVNENDVSIKEATVAVVIENEIEACTHEKALRLKMIENELAVIMHDVKQKMYTTTFEPIVVLALQKSALSLSYLKKSFDTETEKEIYYPSVAKVICNLSLIEEARAYLAQFNRDMPPDLTKTLCNIASIYLKENGNGLEEKTHANANTTSATDANREKIESKMPPEVPFPTENEVRKKRIEIDLLSIIKDVEVNYLGDSIEDEAIDSLFKAANKLVFVKKYYDVAADMIRYFPSVKTTILNKSLTEKAENFYFNGVHQFPLNCKSALRASAIKLREDFEVDERDDDVVNMAVDVDIGDWDGENQLEKYRDSGMTNDTVSMISSLVDASSLNAEALTYVNEEGHSSIRHCTTENGTNTFDDRKKMDFVDSPKEASEHEDDWELIENSIDEKSLLLTKKYRDGIRKIDQTIVDLESKLIMELNRLDNEATACSLKHKIEAVRIERDRRGVEEQSLAHENNVMAQTEELVEKLRTTEAMLESERMEATHEEVEVEISKEGKKAGKFLSGWIYKPTKKNKLEKEKQKQVKIVKVRLREIDLEKDVNHLKAQLDFVQQQADTKRRNIREWQAELSEEYRNLEELTSVTEEKLKEEMKHLQESYEKEREKLLIKKIYLEKSKNKYDRRVASKKEKLQATFGSEEGKESRRETKDNKMREAGKSQYDHASVNEQQSYHKGDIIEKKNPLDIHEEGSFRVKNVSIQDVISKKERSGKQSSLEPNALNVPEKFMLQVDNEFVADLHTRASSTGERIDKSFTKTNYGEDDTIHSNVTGTAEESLAEERSVGKENSLILLKTADIGKDDNSTQNADGIIPDHLAFLNQPRDLEDELSLRSLEIFDLPEESDFPSKNVTVPIVKEKRENHVENNKTENEMESVPDHSVPPHQPQHLRHTITSKSISKGDESSSKKILASTSGGKGMGAVETMSAKREIAAQRNKYDSSSPHKRLSEMKRNVEVTLERAVAIRNGESSSHHRRTVAYLDRSLGDVGHNSNREISSKSNPSLSAHSRSPRRQYINPIYPMIRETDRLSGFIRRYEKKLGTVCKSLLTLASVSGDEKELLAARELDLPDMLNFIVQQDWYKPHSPDKKSVTIPHFVFSKLQIRNDINPDGNSEFEITAIGKSFLRIDGPVASDVCRFLTFLNRIEGGMTRDVMQAHWDEIARLSGDEQSQRVRDKLDKLISFCIESHMIKKISE